MSKRTPDPAPRMPQAPTTPWWNQRRSVVFCAAVLLSVGLLTFAGPSAGIAINRLGAEGGLILCWLIAAAGYGSLLALPRDQRTATLRFVTRIAIGLGIIGLLQLGLGLIGFVSRASALGIVGLGILFAAASVLANRRRLRAIDDWLREPAGWDWLWLMVIPFLAMALVAALVPPGALWGDEPHGYDVLEYHLQLPREWYENHRITPLHHNVFSYFPLGVEMHYMLAMQLHHSPWAGMYLAQLMHVAMVALAVAAVYAVGKLSGSRAAATIAAVAAATVPWMTMLAPVAYNEGGMLLFGALAIGWAMHALTSDGRAIGSWAVAGAAAGFACGVKLTAVPMLLALIPIGAVIVTLIQEQNVKRVMIGSVIFLVVGLTVFSPWLIKNVAWTGNPIFPEAQSLLGRAHFSDIQTERWRRAHSPTEAQRPLRARLAAAVDQLIKDWRFGYVIIPLSVVAFAFAWRQPQAWMLGMLLVFLLTFWIFLTHLQGRFFVLAIPIAALLAAQNRARWGRAVLVFLVAAQFVIALYFLGVRFIDRVGPFTEHQLLAIDDLSGFLPQEVEDAMKRGVQQFALVGDARAFLYRVPMANLRYRTVFDVDAVGGKSVIEAWLSDQSGSPAIVVDPIELQRFSRTYYGIPPIPDELPGPRDRTFLLVTGP